jgi:molecular chaperone HtpG
MAELLPEKVTMDPKPFIGYQMLNIITSGMYDDPLMIYREYVQNAADSIDMATQNGMLAQGQGFINIQIQGDTRIVCIEDNGTGLPYHAATKMLLNLGYSPKEGGGHRGFRGIGRLGGLAYCDMLRFETRSFEDDDITVVEWDRKKLDTALEDVRESGLTEVVKDITRMYVRKPTSNDPGHFFRAEMRNVRRFHSDKLMGIKIVRDYLSQVAPVPYNKASFSYAEKVEKHFADVPAYKTYRISVNDKSITRPYANKIQVSSNILDAIKDVELFELPGTSKPLARGWYAIMEFKGSLPPSVSMRGIRVRHGNIEVGDEFFLSPLYLERRFATWTIGEIHICDRRIRPNARRDGFEQTSEYESFLEQTNALGRFLSHLCRKSSSQRSRTQTLASKLKEIESALANTVLFIDEEHQRSLIASAREKLENARLLLDASSNGQVLKTKYQELRLKVDSLSQTSSFFHDCVDGRSIRHADKVQIIGKILKALYLEYGKAKSAEDLIQKVLAPFLKASLRKSSL